MTVFRTSTPMKCILRSDVRSEAASDPFLHSTPALVRTQLPYQPTSLYISVTYRRKGWTHAERFRQHGLQP